MVLWYQVEESCGNMVAAVAGLCGAGTGKLHNQGKRGGCFIAPGCRRKIIL